MRVYGKMDVHVILHYNYDVQTNQTEPDHNNNCLKIPERRAIREANNDSIKKQKE